MKNVVRITLGACLLFVGMSRISATEEEQVSTGSPVKEIIVVCKTHFDIGYTHRVSEVVDYYRTSMIDKAMKTMDESNQLPPEQQFQWTLPGWVLYKTMEDWDGQSPERKQELISRFKNGKLQVHALPFTFESDACEPEMMARSLSFSTNLTKKFSLPLPRSGKQTDVPSHAGALATVLANAGVKFLHIGCNWPSAPVQTPGLFWWEGPDGSKVLTLYSSMYGTFYDRGSSWRSSDDIMMGDNLLPPPEWPYETWPAILVTGDNSGAPSAKYIKGLLDDLHQKMPGVKVRMGTMDDFYDAIMKEDPNIPTLKTEMPDTWIHGVLCDPEGTRLSRAVNPLIASAEVLHTQLGIWDIDKPSIQEEVAKVYENIALYGEHTWGGSKSVNKYGEEFQKLSRSEYEGLEASWEDKTNYIREAARVTKQITSDNLEALAASVKHSADEMVVYNPLPWVRSGIVEVDGIPYVAEDIPACGYRVVSKKLAKNLSTVHSKKGIENKFFRISFDTQKGCISSFIDKRTGREWATNSQAQGLGQYLNERFTLEQTQDYVRDYQGRRTENNENWLHTGMYKPGMISETKVPYQAVCSGQADLHITETNGTQVAELSMPGAPQRHLSPTTLRITLYKDMPYVDMEMTIHDKVKDNWPEADWFCLPFQVNQPEFRVYRTLGVMNPKTDIQPGANRTMYTVGNGVAMIGADGSGIGICPLDHPLISIGEPGCWKFSYDYVPQKPVVYINMYNNQWNTNFRYWYPGTWSSRVRIWAIDGKEERSSEDLQFTQCALEARNPLLVADGMAEDIELPKKQTGLEVSRPGVLVTAFAPSDEEGTLLRLWEQGGMTGNLVVRLPKSLEVSQAVPVNLRGEKIGSPITIKNNHLEFELGAYAPASFILK